MGPVFIIMIALGFVAAMVGIALIVNNRKKISENEIAVTLAQSSTEGASSVLRSYMAALNNGLAAKIFTHSVKLVSEAFDNKLAATFGSALRIVQQECWIGTEGRTPSCTTIFGIDTIKGPILIYAGTYSSTYKGYKRKLPNWLCKNPEINLEDYVNENSISIYEDLKLALPINMEDNDPMYQKLLQIFEEDGLEAIYEEIEDSPSRVEFFSLAKGSGGYDLTPQSREIKPISKKVLSASYNDITISYEDEDVSVPMGDGVEIMNIALRNNENIFIFGTMGSGKSYLSDELARRVSSKSRTGVIFIPPGMVNELQQVEVLPDLMASIERIKRDYGISNVLFVIDEAEQLLVAPENGIHSITNSFMLSMLNGQIQKMLNCACLLTFNCKPEQLNKAAFRDQRLGMMVELNDLSTEKAAGLVEILQDENPMMIFDQYYWKKLQAKQIVPLASVYKCFVTPSKQRIIIDIMRKVRPDLVKEIPIPKVVAPIIKAPIMQATTKPVEVASVAESQSQPSRHHKHGKKNKPWRQGGDKRERNN